MKIRYLLSWLVLAASLAAQTIALPLNGPLPAGFRAIPHQSGALIVNDGPAAQVPVTLFGLPLLYLYLFVGWGLLILLAATIAERREAAEPRRVESDPPPTDAPGLLRRVDAALAAPRRGVQVAALASAADAAETATDASERVEARAIVSGGRELVLSWLLSRESSDAARAWLLSRYATQLTRPGCVA